MVRRDVKDFLSAHMLVVLATSWIIFYILAAVLYFFEVGVRIPEILFHIGNVFGVALIIEFVITTRFIKDMRKEQLIGNISMLIRNLPLKERFRLGTNILETLTERYGKDKNDAHQSLLSIIDPLRSPKTIMRENSVFEFILKETENGLTARHTGTYYIYNFGERTQVYPFKFRSLYDSPVRLGLRFVKVKYPGKSFENIDVKFVEKEKGIYYLEKDMKIKPGEKVGIQLQYAVEITGKRFEDYGRAFYGLMKDADFEITAPNENYKVEFIDFHKIKDVETIETPPTFHHRIRGILLPSQGVYFKVYPTKEK